jgi:hypothetical protein
MPGRERMKPPLSNWLLAPIMVLILDFWYIIFKELNIITNSFFEEEPF